MVKRTETFYVNNDVFVVICKENDSTGLYLVESCTTGKKHFALEACILDAIER